jgi:hypothetical protein
MDIWLFGCVLLVFPAVKNTDSSYYNKCERGMFRCFNVTQSRVNGSTDLDEILHGDSLQTGLKYKIVFMPGLHRRSCGRTLVVDNSSLRLRVPTL